MDERRKPVAMAGSMGSRAVAPGVGVSGPESAVARDRCSIVVTRADAVTLGTGRRTILLYGALAGLLIVGLKLAEYRFLVVEHSLEIYGGIVALAFAALGIWLGLKMTGRPVKIVTREVSVPVPVEVRVEVPVPVEVRVEVPASPTFQIDQARLDAFGITPRELEILVLIAEGLSNREIAARLFVSENTVKTHSGRLFEKLDARRRTQAVQIAKAAGLLP
jgi:DNA-binding CsgD family transcriptional regulator